MSGPAKKAAPDLDDISRCPLGIRCECCGAERRDLAVVAADLGSLGVACLTMCPACASSTTSPPVAIGTAQRLVLQHAAHVGAKLTAEEIRLLDEEADRRLSAGLHDPRAARGIC